MKDSTVRDLKKGPLTLLTGDRFNERFLLRKCMVVLHWSLVGNRKLETLQQDFKSLLENQLSNLIRKNKLLEYCTLLPFSIRLNQ